MHCSAEDAMRLITTRTLAANMSRRIGDKAASDSEQKREAITQKAKVAAASIRQLITTVGMTLENKIAIEDQINNLSHETESMLYRIDDIARVNQKKVLEAYKRFLEHNLEAVNHRLQELK